MDFIHSFSVLPLSTQNVNCQVTERNIIELPLLQFFLFLVTLGRDHEEESHEED